jgi:hypothetical protein
MPGSCSGPASATKKSAASCCGYMKHRTHTTLLAFLTKETLVAGRKKASRKKNPSHHATLEEAQNGIYIDFEGFKGKTPALLGILYPDRFEQVILDPDLADAARAKQLRCEKLEDIIEEVVAHCEASGQYLFSFSQHELKMVSQFAPDMKDRFKAVSKDSKKIATRWYNRKNPDACLKERTQNNLMKVIGQPPKAWKLQKKATYWLEHTKDTLEKRGSYKKFSKPAKNNWWKLLDYNEEDCRELQTLTLFVLAPGNS